MNDGLKRRHADRAAEGSNELLGRHDALRKRQAGEESTRRRHAESAGDLPIAPECDIQQPMQELLCRSFYAALRERDAITCRYGAKWVQHT